MKKVSVLLAFLLVGLQLSAQQNLFISQNIESAVVDNDGRVTFRFIAPDAKVVQIAGDFVQEKVGEHVNGMVGSGVINMKKDVDGVWTYTSEPLPSELYSYEFLVDGVPTIDPNNPYVYRDFATITNVFLVEGGIADLFKVHDVPHGTLHSCWYHSEGLQMDRRINVYTPAGYESSGERYPVLYLLHGMGGDEDEWVVFGRACQIMDNLIAQNRAVPMMVVMTNGHAAMSASPGESSLGYYKPHYFESGTMDGVFEKEFPQIVSYIDANYRTVASKDGRAIAGLSMGGFHSALISANYPDMFAYVGLFSAAMGVSNIKDSEMYSDLEGKIINQFSKGVKLYWTGIGTDDFLYKANKDFRAMLDKNKLCYTFRQSSGGHVWNNWRLYLSEFTPLIFR